VLNLVLAVTVADGGAIVLQHVIQVEAETVSVGVIRASTMFKPN